MALIATVRGILNCITAAKLGWVETKTKVMLIRQDFPGG
jgi:hypothetical protein